MNDQLSFIEGGGNEPRTKSQQTTRDPKTTQPKRKISALARHEFPFESIRQQIITKARKYFERHGYKKAILGVSGGVDSSLVLKLAVESLGAENVFALLMPELSVTKQENIDHAKALCGFLGITSYYQPINSFLIDFKILPWMPSKSSLMNAKARIRMCMLYNYANTHNALVLGTSNKSELLLGYATKYGDLACDIEIIGDLFKTDVIALANYIGLPPEIVNKTPTAELKEGQTDEGELGWPYEEIDKVLRRIDLGLNGCIDHGMPVNLVHRVFHLVEQNKHKTQLPYIIKIS